MFLKPIISVSLGVAGRSIQRVIKRYGVYVKFNSAEEMRQLALDDEENVLARTPAKTHSTWSISGRVSWSLFL